MYTSSESQKGVSMTSSLHHLTKKFSGALHITRSCSRPCFVSFCLIVQIDVYLEFPIGTNSDCADLIVGLVFFFSVSFHLHCPASLLWSLFSAPRSGSAYRQSSQIPGSFRFDALSTAGWIPCSHKI